MDGNRRQIKNSTSSKENMELREIRRIVGDVRRSDYHTTGGARLEEPSAGRLSLDAPDDIRDSAMVSQRSTAKVTINRQSVISNASGMESSTFPQTNSNAPNPFNRPDSSNPFATTSLVSKF